MTITTSLTFTKPAKLITDSIEGAHTVALINQFIMIGGVIDVADQAMRYGVRWCSINDPTDWPTPASDDARSKQAGQQIFPIGFGFVTSVVGNDFYGYIFQERAITKATYVGGDVVFSFDTFEEERGCRRVGRTIKVEDKVFFESSKGFHLLENDQVSDIGYGKVDDTYAG